MPLCSTVTVTMALLEPGTELYRWEQGKLYSLHYCNNTFPNWVSQSLTVALIFHIQQTAGQGRPSLCWFNYCVRGEMRDL